METIPGLLIFHILLTENPSCLDDFIANYHELSTAIIMQGYICFALVLLAGLWFLYSLLLFLLGDREKWSRNTKATAGFLEEEEAHRNGHGYVIRDNQVFI